MDEFVIEWIKGKTVASVTFPSSSRWASKVRKLAEEYPEFSVIADENGALFAHIPVSCITIRKPMSLSEEQREAARQNFKKKGEEHGTDH